MTIGWLLFGFRFVSVDVKVYAVFSSFVEVFSFTPSSIGWFVVSPFTVFSSVSVW